MPRFAMSNPHDQDPERAQLVQAYMVLHAKQTSVRRRLSAPPTYSPASSASSSPEPHPARPCTDFAPSSPRPSHRSSPSKSSFSPSRHQRAAYLRRPSVPSIPETTEEHDIDSDEDKLCDINRRIEATLTHLLNCESVKHDDRMREWVLSRLVEAQRTLSERSRQESVSSISSSSSSLSTSSSPSPYRRSTAGSPVKWTPAYTDGMRVDDLLRSDMMRKWSL